MSDYRLFFDENGTSSLNSIDPNFPILCLTGVLFEKHYYHSIARKMVDDFKLEFWDRTDVILHSRDIRKQHNDFSILADQIIREHFYTKLNELIMALEFKILSVVINKTQLLSRYGKNASNPYCLSLEFIMERMCKILKEDCNSIGYMIGESRGKNEDKELIDVYHKLIANGNHYIDNFSSITNFWLEKKEKNITGLQIADLVSYPISTKVLFPDRNNLAFDIINKKIVRSKEGRSLGYGIKIFPSPNIEISKIFLK